MGYLISSFRILSDDTMVAPILEATDLARVVLPTPGNPQKRRIIGITNEITRAKSPKIQSLPKSDRLKSK